MVLLDVKTSEMVQSKADHDPTPTEAVINTVRVYAYNQTGSLIGYADNTHKYDTKDGEAFHMALRVPDGQDTETVDFYVVANEEELGLSYDLTSDMGIDDLNDIIYAPLPYGGNLPMYAILEDQVLDLNQGETHFNNPIRPDIGFHLTQKIELNLTRSLAKVEVFAAQKVKGSSTAAIEESEARINTENITFLKSGVMAKSWLFPANAPYQTSVTADIEFTPLSPKVYDSIGEAASDEVKTNEAYYTQVMGPHYFAETSTMVIQLTYSFGSGAPKTAQVNMPKIQRNYFYKVFCLIESSGKISLTVIARPWDDTDEQVIVYDDHIDAQAISWSGVELSGTTAEYPSTGAGQEAVFSFTLPKTEGAIWIASIKEGDIQDFAFAGGKKTTTGTLDGTPVDLIIKTLTNNYLSGSPKKVNIDLIVRTDCGRNIPVRYNGQDIEFTIIQNQI
jgi:hypothetical protein